MEAGCWRRVPVLGVGRRCWCCELAVDVVETGCRVLVRAVVLVLGAVSWLRAWWRQGAGAGRWQCAWWRQLGAVSSARGGDWAPLLGAGPCACWGQGAGCWCWVLGTGAGCNSCVKGCTVCADSFARRNVRLSTDHCFSVFQHATHTIVALDTAWPWASEAHGLAGCTHTFVRINLYAQDHMALSFYRSLLQACYKVNSGAGYCLALGH